MIVVVGQPLYRDSEENAAVDGLAARIALAAAARGRVVQLVGKAGEDAAGDAVVLALARGGVGHVAMLRDAGRPTPRTTSRPSDPPAPGLEAADVELALRYLADFAVIVLADRVAPDVVRVAAAASSWADTRLIVVVPTGGPAPQDLPPDALTFEAPDADPDGAFATMVAAVAATLDGGADFGPPAAA